MRSQRSILANMLLQILKGLNFFNLFLNVSPSYSHRRSGLLNHVLRAPGFKRMFVVVVLFFFFFFSGKIQYIIRDRSASGTLIFQIPRTKSTLLLPAPSLFRSIYMEWLSLSSAIENVSELIQMEPKNISFPQSCRTAMFSVSCCCLHPSQVSVWCPF